MDLSAREVHEKQFHDAWRGYNQSEVDDFLDRVAESLDRLTRENDDLKTRIRELDQAMAASRDTEEMLKKTLVTAQRAAEEAIANAKAKAEELISEADAHVQRSETVVRERVAQADAEVKRRSSEWEQQAANKRRDLDERIEKLRLLESDIKQRLKAFMEQQMRALQALDQVEPARGPTPQARPAAQRPAPAPAQGGGEPPPGAQPRPEGPGPATQAGTEPTEQRKGVRDLFHRQQG